MSSTAARVPAELLIHILKFFASDLTPKGFRMTVPVLLSKRELSRCALVCRYWARTCQPFIFGVLTLRSRQDAEDLIALATSPRSKVGDYVQELRLVYTAESTPWIHLIPTMLILKQVLTWRFLFVNLEMVGLHQREYVQPGSIHSSLPRRIPAFSYPMTHIRLTNIKLRSLGDLFRLMAEIPNLRLLSCNQLSWKVAPSEESDSHFLYGRHSRCGHFLNCTLTECPDSWAAFALSHNIQRRQRDFTLDDYLSVLMITRVITTGQHGSSNSATQIQRTGQGNYGQYSGDYVTVYSPLM